MFPATDPAKHITRNSLYGTWVAVQKLAGVENLHQHDFRAILVAEAHYHGIDIQTASKVLGHKSSKTTEMHYLRVRSDKIAQAVKVTSRPLVKAFGLDEAENDGHKHGGSQD